MEILVRNWGWVALRGVAALPLGVLALYRPGMRLLALIVLFGAYACADGAFTLASSLGPRQGRPGRSALLVGGVAGIALGTFMLVEPHYVAVVPLDFIATWAVCTGLAGMVAGIGLRQVAGGEWLLLLAGLLSLVFGLVLVVFPGIGAFAVMIGLGAYAVLSGIVLLALALRLRAWGRQVVPEAPPPAA